MADFKPNSNTIRFLHASDIHLGTKILQNSALCEDYTNALKAILDACVQFNANFLILGGDTFTGLEMLPKTFGSIVDLLHNFQAATNSQIPIIAIEGNHDLRRFSYGTHLPYRYSWIRVLASMGLLILLDGINDQNEISWAEKSTPSSNVGGRYQIGNVVIYGTRYLGEQPQPHFPEMIKALPSDGGCFRILLQHFGIDGTMDGVPGVPLEDVLILRPHFGYLALGHFHQQFRCQNWIFNPGSPITVSSGEYTLPRGVFLVELECPLDQKPRIRKVQSLRIPERKLCFETIYFPKNITTHEQVRKHILGVIQSKYTLETHANHTASSRSPLLQIQLTGYKPKFFNQKEIRRDLCEKLHIASLTIKQDFSTTNCSLDSFFSHSTAKKKCWME